MSGHIGLREESRAGHLLARRIARLFAVAASQPTKRTTGKSAAVGDALCGLDNGVPGSVVQVFIEGVERGAPVMSFD